MLVYTKGTLSKLKKAADLFSGPEKQGVHAIAKANENIVDVEITLDATSLPTKRKHPRMDMAVFEQRPDAVELVFWEAKLFVNKELRAKKSSEPDVVDQIKEYIEVLKATDVLSSYRRVAENLVAIAEMSTGARQVGSAIRAVAGGAKLNISYPAHVGLVIFGYDADQNAQESIGRTHFEKLEQLLPPKSVRACGKAKDLKLCHLG